MKLQRQLLLVSILLLSLPWAGCQYILSIDATLQFAQEQSLKSTTQAIAAVLAQEPKTVYPNDQRLTNLLYEEHLRFAGDKPTHHEHYLDELFFTSISYPIIIDGYGAGEWGAIPTNHIQAIEGTDTVIQYQTASDKHRLYLYFEVNDKDIVYHNPTTSNQENGDRLVLVTGNNTRYILRTSAPGSIKAYYKTKNNKYRSKSAIKAAWQDNGNGYTVELSIPIKLVEDRLGFYVVNENSNSNHTITGTYTSRKKAQPPAWIIYPPELLAERLEIFTQAGTRISVIDRHYWPLSQTGKFSQAQAKHGNWLLRKLYRAILKGKHAGNPEYQRQINHHGRLELSSALDNTPDSVWYTDPSNSDHSILSYAVPIVVNGQVIAAVLAEQSSDRFVALTDEAFNRLLLFSLAALIITGLGLLGYSSWLSWRIRRLSFAAQQVLSDDGTLLNNFPSSRAADEIGDLTRSYATLLTRIHDYTEYLQTLSRKLSHELRTPLAIIHSSLDNLEHCNLEEDAKTYQQRAKDGASRLGNILTAMSEATRVEQSIQNAEPEPINLAALLHSVSAAYNDLHQEHHISLRGVSDTDVENPDHITQVVPDLIVQTLDKLIDNAVDFCPKDGHIIIEYKQSHEHCTISVSNDGPLLPQAMQHQLFDNMVSLRTDHSDQSHLGLGLHIAQLIVQYHNGKISATNREDNTGVIFTITLPKRPTEAGKGQIHEAVI